mmetsp:Transcript_9283/g.13776  ORF Transcript_9283/g.13776 Transcript_9283/m.13776 type:complete len:131 (-) Transcript_9283:1255-1647(-)
MVPLQQMWCNKMWKRDSLSLSLVCLYCHCYCWGHHLFLRSIPYTIIKKFHKINEIYPDAITFSVTAATLSISSSFGDKVVQLRHIFWFSFFASVTNSESLFAILLIDSLEFVFALYTTLFYHIGCCCPFL